MKLNLGIPVRVTIREGLTENAWDTGLASTGKSRKAYYSAHSITQHGCASSSISGWSAGFGLAAFTSVTSVR